MKKILLLAVLTYLAVLTAEAEAYFSFSFSEDSLITNTIEKDGLALTSLSYNDLPHTCAIKQPKLPVKKVFVSVPANATNFRIKDLNTVSSRLKLPYKIEYVSDELCGGNEPVDLVLPIESTPINAAIIEQAALIAGKDKIVSLLIYPVTATNALTGATFNNTVSFNLEWDTEDIRTRPLNTKSPTIDVKGLVSNASDIEKNRISIPSPTDVDPDECNYLIIAPRRLCKSLEKLAAMRRLKGYSPMIIPLEYILNAPKYKNGDEISGINDDAGKIRQFLREMKSLYELQYVLFAGKYPEMPIRYAHEKGLPDINYHWNPTDLYFSDLYSNWDNNNNGCYGEYNETVYNYFGDIAVGRIPFSTTEEVENYTEKLWIYEHNPGNGDASYLAKSLLTRQFEHSAANAYDNHTLTAYLDLYPDENLVNMEQKGTADPWGYQVINRLNVEPCGNWNFIGHGVPGGVAVSDFFNGQRMGIVALDQEDCGHFMENGNGLDNLKNKYYPAWSFSMSCTHIPFDIFTDHRINKTFDLVYNFGESFLMGKEYGGVVYMGNTRPSYRSNGRAMIKQFFETLGDAWKADVSFKNGVFAGDIFPYTKATSMIDHRSRCIYNLLGDPVTPLWISEPEKLAYIEHINYSEDIRQYSITGTTEDSLYVVHIPVEESFYNPSQLTSVKDLNLFQLDKNQVTVVYGKHSLPVILPLCIQGIDFPSYKGGYIIADEVRCGSHATNEFSSRNVNITNDACVHIEALGNVHISEGTILHDRSSLEIVSKKDVYLSDISIPAGCKVYIKAQKIHLKNVLISEAADLTLIGEVVKEQPSKAKLLVQDPHDFTDTNMIVEGRTWWYKGGHYYCSGLHEESAFSIGEPVILEDGTQWNKILLTYAKQWNPYTQTLISEDLDENSIVGYIKQDGETVQFLQDKEHYLGNMYTTYIQNMSYHTHTDSNEINNLYNFSNEGAIFPIGFPSYGSKGEIQDISNIENTGNIFKKYKVRVKVPDNSNFSNFTTAYVSGIGIVNYNNGDTDFNYSYCGLFCCPLPSMYGNELIPELRYVTDKDNNIIYTGIGGMKAWEEMDGIADITVDAEMPGEEIWFSVTGQRITQPTAPGIYLRRQGNTTVKVRIN